MTRFFYRWSSATIVNNIVVIRNPGTVGNIFIKNFSILFNNIFILGFSSNKSSQSIIYNYTNENSIGKVVLIAWEKSLINLVIVVVMGTLYYSKIIPKKFHFLFEANTTLYAFIMKYSILRLNRKSEFVFTALPAGVEVFR